MKLTWDHHNSILQLSGSLFQHYGIERVHGTDCDVDAWLRKTRPRCVISLLIDAMGISIMAKHLPEDSFLHSHLLKEITTVFPPTTAAATTSYRSGYSPAETGWLGWNQYFPEKDDELTRAVIRLPIRLREVILLYYYQGLNVNEIAEALDISQPSVSGRLKRGRERLKDMLEGRENDA